MKVEALPGSVGAPVGDLPLDFTQLGAADTAMLSDAFDEYSLLVLGDGRDISLDEQYAICGIFGALIDQASNGTTTMNVSNRGASTKAKLCFHADFTDAPPGALLTGASLYGLVLPEEATSTVYANSGPALAAMPEELRERIRGLSAVHANAGEGFVTDAPGRHQPGAMRDPRSEHPIELTYPRTGKKFMLVSDLGTERVVGLDDGESLRLLNELNEWLQQPQFVFHHYWQLHDLVVWGNLVMQHSRGEIGHLGERTLRRVPFTYPGWADECQRYFDRPDVFGSSSKRVRM